MRALLILLLLVWMAPASAGLFDSKPNATLGGALNNAADFLPVRDAFQVRLIDSTPQKVRVQFVIAEGYYLYRQRLQFTSSHPEVQIEATLPEGESKVDPYFGEVQIYRAILDVSLIVTNPKQQSFSIQIGYQGCADKGLCYPPETEVLKIVPTTLQPVVSAPVVAAPATDAHGVTVAHFSWQSLALFFVAGIGLTFTPCVLPMLPILSGVVLRVQPGGRHSLSLSLAYVVPMSLCFALLGTLTGLFGAELNIQSRLQSPWILAPFSMVFGVLALAMFGVFELRLPLWLSEPLDRFSRRRGGGSLAGAALMGVLSSILVSPCVSAPLAGALLYISGTGDALGGGLKLFALGLGMGAPLIVLATGWGTLLPKTGPWMLGVRNLFGVLLLAVAIWMLERVLPGPIGLMLWGLLAVGTALFLGALEGATKTPVQRLYQGLGVFLLVYGVSCWVGALQGRSDPLQPLAGYPSSGQAEAVSSPWITLETPAALEAQLTAAQQAGQSVILDWYADWCISCKLMERQVLNHEQVVGRLSRYRLLRLDVTRNTLEQRALLDQFKLFGPPAILFFNQKGEEVHWARILGETDSTHFLGLMDRFEQQGLSPVNSPVSTAIAL